MPSSVWYWSPRSTPAASAAIACGLVAGRGEIGHEFERGHGHDRNGGV